MTDKQIKARLARAVDAATPDVLDAILLRAKQQKGMGQNMETATNLQEQQAASKRQENNILHIGKDEPAARAKTRRGAIRWVSMAAALLLVVIGGYGAHLRFAVDSVIGIDVNPSIELKTNRAEKVLLATALNADAHIVLDNMNLQNVDLDVAVNALIGSMLKHGYVSEIKNSILITVENEDASKSQALQSRISSEISSLLDAYSIGGAVLSQSLTEDERIKALANEHGVSFGKAALVDLLVEQDPRLQFADIAALPINDINLLIASHQADLEGVNSNGQASSSAYIGEARAKEIALAHAGTNGADTVFEKTKLDYEDGRMVYEVDFRTADAEYEYEIDALNGDILEYDRDALYRSSAPSTPSTPSTPSDVPAASGGSSAAALSKEAAKSIALEDAGLAASAVTFTKEKLEYDDGVQVYDIAFYTDDAKYEYEIHASSGKIREREREAFKKSSSSASGGTSGSSSGNANSDAYIGASKAKSIALAHAGLSAAEVRSMEVELDRENGKMVYEVEFDYGKVEYDYCIDALSGAILKYDTDYD